MRIYLLKYTFIHPYKYICINLQKYMCCTCLLIWLLCEG